MSDASILNNCRTFVSRHQRVVVPVSAGAAYLCTSLGLALPQWVSWDVQSFGTLRVKAGLWQDFIPIGCAAVGTYVQKGEEFVSFIYLNILKAILAEVCGSEP